MTIYSYTSCSMVCKKTRLVFLATLLISIDVVLSMKHRISIWEVKHDREKREADVGSVIGAAGAGASAGAAVGGPVGAVVGGVLAAVVCFFFCGGDDTDRSPPTLTCYLIPDQIIPQGQRSTVVTWTEPTAVDPDTGVKGIQKVQGGPSNGATLKKGSYQVSYYATNGDGINSEPCVISFSVTLIECGYPSRPSRGSVTCTSPQGEKPAFGETCTFACEAGYNLIGGSTQTCQQDGQYSGGGTVDCQKKLCPAPTLLDFMSISSCTDEYLYESSCQMACSEGYGLPVGVTNTLTCEADQTWSGDLEPCKDIQPPVFDTCPGPDAITVFTERGGKYGIATWDEPTASDPQGGPVVVYQTVGPASGSQFFLEPDNVHLIIYSAVDSEINEAEQCEFNIIVQERVCPPYPYSERLNVTCYDDLAWGSQCDLECDRGYPLNGSSVVYCEETADGTSVNWDWSAGKPFCKVVPCPDLDPPENGALTCALWIHGRYCQMQCSDQFDIPRTIATSGEWVCDDTTGIWNPNKPVPGCTATRRPGSMYLPNELFYFSGDCSDTTTQDQIKQNFITQLSQSRFSTLCTEYDECTVDNVDVSCGSVSTGRRKKSTHTHRIRIDFRFKITLVYPDGFKSTDSTSFLGDVDDKLNGMASLFAEDVNNKTMDLTVPGLDIETDANSFKSGLSEMICDTGMVPKYDTFSCASCPTGTMYNSTIDDCKLCPLGTYQDGDGQLTCKQCPGYTSTLKTGSTRLDQCIDMCSYGHYSENGLEDCALCPVGTYQDSRGATECMSCPTDTTTLSAGSTDVQLCLTNEQIQDLALCNRTRCNGGFCLRDSDASVRCVCHGGFTGEFCQIAPDPCDNNLCQHGGSCVATDTSYICSCVDGFNGDYCQNELVNGGYTTWSQWTACSVTCGSGSSSRDRECVNPPPGPGGLPCQGETQETAACNTQICPVCPPIQFPYGHITTCTDHDNNKVCQMKCRDGLMLYSDLKPKVICGRSTNYVWSHSVGDPADIDKLPKCTITRMSEKMTVEIELENQNLGCDANIDTDNIKTYVGENTNCSDIAACRVDVTTECRAGTVRRKRNTGTSVVVVKMDGTITDPDYFPGGVYDNDIATLAAEEFKDIITNMYALVQGLESGVTDGTLHITADGQNYVPTMNMNAYMDCPAGSMPLYGLCTTCPAGTYQKDKQCESCELGKYQDQEGMIDCALCPVGTTTFKVGAETQDECAESLICQVGTYQNGGNCDPCKLGFYQDQEGYAYCKPCPTGSTTQSVGTKTVSECSITVGTDNTDNPTDTDDDPTVTDDNPTYASPTDATGNDQTTTAKGSGDYIPKESNVIWSIVGSVIGAVIIVMAIVIGVFIWNMKSSRKPTYRGRRKPDTSNAAYGLHERVNGASPKSTILVTDKPPAYESLVFTSKHSKHNIPDTSMTTKLGNGTTGLDLNQSNTTFVKTKTKTEVNHFGTDNPGFTEADESGVRPASVRSIRMDLIARKSSVVSLGKTDLTENSCPLVD